MRFAFFIAVAAGWLLPLSSASAQGLVWSLPEDGTWVRYEGDYREVEFRPNSPQGNENLQWDRHLTVRSVGSETAEFAGEQQPCRWIEFEVLTGHTIEGEIEPGPVGTRIYKVLVPESRITGQLTYEAQIPVSFLPIVRGFQKLGEQQVEPLEGNVLQVFPVISLLPQCRPENMEKVSPQPEDAGLTLGQVSAERYKCTRSAESKSNRSVAEAELWRSDDVPFGLARWTVTIRREHKESVSPRSEFAPVAEVSVDMKAIEIGSGAQSAIVTP